MDQAKKSHCTDLVAGAAPMPREMSFPLGASENWNDVYDYIRYVCVLGIFMFALITLQPILSRRHCENVLSCSGEHDGF